MAAATIENNKDTNLVHPKDMTNSQIGVIRRWGANGRYIGLVVQKVNMIGGSSVLCAIGDDSYWSKLDDLTQDCQVEILQPGALLRIN